MAGLSTGKLLRLCGDIDADFFAPGSEESAVDRPWIAHCDWLPILLYDWLQAANLNERARFSDHSRETFDAVFDTCERIARRYRDER